MRKIETHVVEGKCANLTVECLDKPGAGGACHHYFIGGYHTKGNPSADSSCDDETAVHLLFQNGPIDENGNGVNGLQNEAVLAVLIDRMEGFVAGPYPCVENSVALHHLRQAMEVLRQRTQLRITRGVEGTHQK